MRLKDLDTVKVRLVVLDDSTIVSAQQVLIRMRKHHASHWSVVRLQDRLKVKVLSVPQSELATGRASNDALSVRSHGNRGHGKSDLPRIVRMITETQITKNEETTEPC